jgi:phage/plasmid-associated DNA primase
MIAKSWLASRWHYQRLGLMSHGPPQFGLLLTPDMRYQKAFLIVGPKRSGKGTIARVLKDLLGPASVCDSTLNGLGQQFGLAPLIGKRLAIIPDARLGTKVDEHVILERLLAITGEDALDIDHKYRDHWVRTRDGSRTGNGASAAGVTSRL